MTTIVHVYAGLALIVLGLFGAISSIAASLFFTISKDVNAIRHSMIGVCAFGGLTFISNAVTIFLSWSHATIMQHRRQVVFGRESNDPDRIQRVQLLRWLRLFGPMYPWVWTISTMIYVALCFSLKFLISQRIAHAGSLFGLPSILAIPFSYVVPPIVIYSLEIVAGYRNDPDINLN